MSCRFRSRWLLSISLVLGISVAALGDDWPQWLGPQRDSVWRETGIVDRFPDGGPPVKWSVDVGIGYAGPAVADGRVYLMDRQQTKDADGNPVADDRGTLGTERVLCYAAADGQPIWQHEYDCPYNISYPFGPRTTPVIEGDRCYTLGAMGDLICFDAISGDVIWSKNLREAYQTNPPVWGWATHPLIDGNKLICLVGGEGSAVVAFDKRDGRELWKTLTVEEIGYAPPMIYESDGSRQLIVWHDLAVQSLNPDNGQSYWSVAFPADGKLQRPAVPIMTPMVSDGQLLVSQFYDGSMFLDVQSQPPAATVRWSSDKVGDPMHDESLNVLMMTPLIRDGHIYGVSGQGHLRCLDAKTGKVIWSDVTPTGDRPNYFATCFLVQHEDRYFIFNDQGYLIMARLSPQGYQEIDRAKLLEPLGFARGRNIVWSHPAFANRSMFARNDKHLICVDLAE